jgi:hypothetical protein
VKNRRHFALLKVAEFGIVPSLDDKCMVDRCVFPMSLDAFPMLKLNAFGPLLIL